MSDANTLTPWHSFPLKKAVSGDAVIGSFGGHPRGIRAHEWPRCGVCGSPMCHMAQLDAGPWLDLNGNARLTLFICHATGGQCEDWDPWKGANKALIQKKRDDSMFDGPPTVRVYRRVALAVESPVDEYALMQKAKEQGTTREAIETLRRDKLGGGAVWLHQDDTPKSPSGGSPMRLLLQITTNIVAFDITPGGMGWVFQDPTDPSEGSARMLWQGG